MTAGAPSRGGPGDQAWTASDAAAMKRALHLAERGRGRVSPNPMVGAIVVDGGGAAVGEGYHHRVGEAHAEDHALRAAGARARGSTLYCTLEPCCFHGRTPPCAEAIAAAGVRRVVCALQDPDPRVDGGGLQFLRAAGVQVEVGLGAAQAEAQNAAYLCHRRRGRPLVILKLGQTLDGRVATSAGRSRWITSEASRRHAHRWRSWVDAVAVGAGTVVADDPQLTARPVGGGHQAGRQPRPLVVDGRLRCPPQARVFGGHQPILATSEAAPVAARRAFEERGVEVWVFPDGGGGAVDLGRVLARAGQAGVTSLLVEGGPTLAAAALRARLVDRAMLYLAPRLMGAGLAALGDLGIEELERMPALEQVRIRRLGTDLLYTGEVVYPCSPA